MTRLLLDTHLLLWWLNGDARLPQAVIERVQAPQAEIFISQASLWEMAINVSIGRLQVDLQELERQVPPQGFRWLPISNTHLLAVADLESDGVQQNGVQRDPFDRRMHPALTLCLEA